jgi:surface polysaccharide O-acyltransferase-like enzyme
MASLQKLRALLRHPVFAYLFMLFIFGGILGSSVADKIGNAYTAVLVHALVGAVFAFGAVIFIPTELHKNQIKLIVLYAAVFYIAYLLGALLGGGYANPDGQRAATAECGPTIGICA